MFRQWLRFLLFFDKMIKVPESAKKEYTILPNNVTNIWRENKGDFGFYIVLHVYFQRSLLTISKESVVSFDNIKGEN